MNLEDMTFNTLKNDVLRVLNCILIFPKTYIFPPFEYVLILLRPVGMLYDKANRITSV